MTEQALAELLKTGNCSVDGQSSSQESRPAKKAAVPRRVNELGLNNTEEYYRLHVVEPLLFAKEIVGYVCQPVPLILQDDPKITYKPDFLLILPDLRVRAVEVKAKNKAWVGLREDDKLKMKLLKGRNPHIKMMLALVDVLGQEIIEKCIE